MNSIVLSKDEVCAAEFSDSSLALGLSVECATPAIASLELTTQLDVSHF